MANNVEKFVVDLGFSQKDLNKLKELLKLQDKANKVSKQEQKARVKGKQDELSIDRKRLQMEKLIKRAKEKGVDTTFYERSLKSAKKIQTIEKRRIELERKLLNIKKKVTQEEVKQQVNKGYMNQPSKALFEKSQAARVRDDDYELAREQFARKHVNRLKRAGVANAEAYREQARAAFKLEGATAKLNEDIREQIDLQRRNRMQIQKTNIAMQGLNDSTRHLIRSYASVFAVLGATQAINTTGQKFEAMNSAMLAATGTAEETANEITFLDGMTSRLGLSLLDTSDAYTKFLFASKGKLDQSETRELFEGLSELGTTLGVSKERMKLSMNAITQMMNKGKISSEELRLQLAESLPGK